MKLDVYDYTHLRNKLEGCFVKYDGDFYYCKTISGVPDQVELHKTGDGVTTYHSRRKIEELDVSAPVLGYVNFRGQCYYIERAPYRTMKQGLHKSLIRTINGFKTSSVASHLMFSGGFISMLKNEYPTYEEVINTLLSDDSKTSRSFHRDLALKIEQRGCMSLLFKGQVVAYKERGEDRFSFLKPQKNRFIKKLAEIEGVPC